MRGRRIGADEALALGLVTRSWPADELDARSHGADRGALAALTAGAAHGKARAQRRLRRAAPLGLELEGLAYGLLRQTHDFREGVEAFGEKRTPEFTGVGLGAGYRRSQASPAASTVSSSGATSCMLPIASPAQPTRLTQRRNDESGSRISSSSTSSGGNSIPTHGLT